MTLCKIPLRKVKEHIIDIFVKVTPKSSSNRIVGIIQNVTLKSFLKIYVTAIPESGRANIEVITLLAKTWRIPRSKCTIIIGKTSRIKTIRIQELGDRDINIIEKSLEDLLIL